MSQGVQVKAKDLGDVAVVAKNTDKSTTQDDPATLIRQQIIDAHAKGAGLSSTTALAAATGSHIALMPGDKAYMSILPIMSLGGVQALYPPADGAGPLIDNNKPGSSEPTASDHAVEPSDESQSKRKSSTGSGSGFKKTKLEVNSNPYMNVKSRSEAALAMLAVAATNKEKGQARQQQFVNEIWGALGVQAATPGTLPPPIPLSHAAHHVGSSDDLPGGLDDKELKKLRRKQSNRESARRSRLRKQEECKSLQEENDKLRLEVEKLVEEKAQLLTHIDTLNVKLNMTTAFAASLQQTSNKTAEEQTTAV